MPPINFDSVSVVYDEAVVLKDISVSLTEHRIGIIGANGSGKSTLIRLINGLGTPHAGTVSVDGLDVAHHAKELRKRIGFVFSDAENQIVMPTVRDDVAFSLKRFKLDRKEKNARVDAALQRFQLVELATNSPHTLSGGQKQMLALAAVLVTEPELVLADEPTALLDLLNRNKIRKIFSDLDQQIITVTHDLEFIDDYDRVLCIDDHRIAFDGAPKDAIAFYKELMSTR